MIHLPELAKKGQQGQVVIIDERLPAFLLSPCTVKASYRIEAKDDYYLICLLVEGNLTSICQRCMKEFKIEYKNDTIIAVCRNDERADQLLDDYECVVSANWQVDLKELITDELHLYALQFHPNTTDCDSEINQILTVKSECD